MQHTISRSERKRLASLSIHEERLRKQGFSLIAGVDEAGRGPLAGPVVAAACILPTHLILPTLNDSKQLTAEQRESLFQQITQNPEILFGIGICDAETIDRINILQATFLAMQRAVAALKTKPDYLLIDGNQLPRFEVPAETLVEGDAKSVSIAAASILAKVTRDRMMEECDAVYPFFGFKQHKGYGTEQHLSALKEHGPCPIHRKSFEPIKSMLKTERQSDFLSDPI